jgi:anaphase-promoting complex subunit 4
MLPALDRCGVILSRFSVIAKFQGSNETVGFTSQQISLITETVACLHLISSKTLMQVVDELDLFHSFSSWLRYEIDRLASNTSNSPNEDAIDKESSIDHSKVLSYLQNVMTTSPLANYFDEFSEEECVQSWQIIEQGVPIFEILGKQLRKQEKNMQSIAPLSRIGLLCKFLGKQAGAIFGQIAEAEKRNVLFGKAQEIGDVEKGSPITMKMNPMVSSAQHTTHALLIIISRRLGAKLMLLLFQRATQILVSKIL